MTHTEAAAVSSKGFAEFEIDEFKYLRSHQNNSLTLPSNQQFDEGGILSLVGQGSLYLVQLVEVRIC